jgi:hypothetical protein
MMALPEVTSADAVRAAIAEFDELGREAFLTKHGFGTAQRYLLVEGGQEYDSKAIFGVAYGYEHPEQGPLSNASFSGGEATVKRQLEALGFEVVDNGGATRSDRQPRVWLVRAGQSGENEDLALSHDVVVIGWQELGDLSGVQPREELRRLFDRTYPDQVPASAAQQLGMVLRFLEIQTGDLVVLPLKTKPGTVAVGRVAGGYEFRQEPEFANDAKHTIAVSWIDKGAPYEAFDADLQKAFGAQGTVRRLHQTDAFTRVLSALRGSSVGDALHLVVKWSSRFRADTVERHLEVVESRGSVWWGLWKTGDTEWRISEQWLTRLQEQIATGVPTHVFIVGESCWETNLRAVTFSRDDIDESLVPALLRGGRASVLSPLG